MFEKELLERYAASRCNDAASSWVSLGHRFGVERYSTKVHDTKRHFRRGFPRFKSSSLLLRGRDKIRSITFILGALTAVSVRYLSRTGIA